MGEWKAYLLRGVVCVISVHCVCLGMPAREVGWEDLFERICLRVCLFGFIPLEADGYTSFVSISSTVQDERTQYGR